ncbi:hypothetical protein [Pseudomonas fluorescens]|uniref:hypothetical protein n=1 Tax=Pseudomonas fluorescens TaxID=294 RepID=UPI00064240B3|nr:hypothetical protein [Pseudomonas fluorescens]
MKLEKSELSAYFISNLASRLHCDGRLKICLDSILDEVPKDLVLPEGCKIIEKDFEFLSVGIRNEIIATSVHSELCQTSGYDVDQLFSRAFELWLKEIGQSDLASGRLLALAESVVDVFSVGAQRIRAGLDVFDVLHLVEAALPYLDRVHVASVVELVAAKYEPTKNDMMAGTINGALERWLEHKPNIACELHSHVLGELSESTASLLGNAIVALSKSDYSLALQMAKQDTLSGVAMREKIGVWTLGRMLLDERKDLDEMFVVIETIKELIESSRGIVRTEAIRAAVNAMHETPAFDEILGVLAEQGDQDVLCFAASAIFFKGKELRERGLLPCWLQWLSALNLEFKGAIRDLDWAMSRLISDSEYADLVIGALSKWVVNNGRHINPGISVAELFGSTVRELILNEYLLSSLLADWLLSDHREHPAALVSILNDISNNPSVELRLDKFRLDQLSSSDMLFLARRMLGYIHDRSQITSLAISMLQANDAESSVYPLLRALLVDEIGYDYPGSTAKALIEAGNLENLTPADKEFLQSAAEAINQSVEAQNALPLINELRPPAGLSGLFSRARAKQMADAGEEASKNSLWRQIATEIPIKAGMGTFSFRDSSYGTSMKLSSISHSFELPRREVFDPIGNSIRHFGFRIAERDEQ